MDTLDGQSVVSGVSIASARTDCHDVRHLLGSDSDGDDFYNELENVCMMNNA